MLIDLVTSLGQLQVARLQSAHTHRDATDKQVPGSGGWLEGMTCCGNAQHRTKQSCCSVQGSPEQCYRAVR